MSELQNYFYSSVRELGYIKSEEAWWVAQIITNENDYFGTSGISLAIRTKHTLMSKEQLNKAGLRGNVKYSSKLYDALTEKGKKNPLEAISKPIMNALFSMSREQRLNLAIKNGEVIIVTAGNCCPKTIEKFGKRKVFELKQLPAFPTETCDQETCNCSFRNMDIFLANRLK